MILTALIAVAFASPVDDFYPLTVGSKLTYEDSNGLQMTDEIGTPIDIGKGVMATPKVSVADGKASDAELYRKIGDTVFLVGVTDKRAKPPKPSIIVMPFPQPILKVDKDRANWTYVGDMGTGLGPVLVQVKGESKRGPMRKVLSSEVETLLVSVTSKIGNDREAVEVKQDVVYGKGIGLIEMSQVTKAQGQTVRKMLKLVKYEPPQG